MQEGSVSSLSISTVLLRGVLLLGWARRDDGEGEAGAQGAASGDEEAASEDSQQSDDRG
jgi:hypothetical protein